MFKHPRQQFLEKHLYAQKNAYSSLKESQIKIHGPRLFDNLHSY